MSGSVNEFKPDVLALESDDALDNPTTSAAPVDSVAAEAANSSVAGVSDVIAAAVAAANMDTGLAEASAVEQPMETTPSNNEPPQHSDDIVQRLVNEKAALEQTAFNLQEEFSDVKRQFAEMGVANAMLQEQVVSNGRELDERIKLYRKLEASRDDLAIKKTQAEERCEKLKREKEERDLALRRLTTDKHGLSGDVVTLKAQLKNVLAEKNELASEKKAFEQEKRTLTYEAQRARDEKTLALESKKWLLKEVADRDSKISLLRIEMKNQEVCWQNEKNRFSDEQQELREKVNNLEATLKKTSEELSAKIKGFAKEMEEKQVEVEAAEKECQLRAQIAQQYKEALEDANRMIEEQKLTSDHDQTLLRESREAIESMQAEMVSKEDEVEREVALRETRIAELEDELAKANDLIKNKHNLTMTDDELASIAPLAAETSRFLRSGMTLTQLYREHARVVGELEGQKVLNQQLEIELKEVVEDIEKYSPELIKQKAMLDQTLDHNDRLKLQLQQADEQRRSLTQQKDGAIRELSFTKVELEKMQREHHLLKKEAASLVYVLENEREGGSDSPPLDPEERHQKFATIVALQQRNVNLQMELENTKKAVDTAVATAHNEESERLKKELASAQRDMSVVQTLMSGLQTDMKSIENQRDRYKDIIERGGLDPEAAKLRKDAERLQSELSSANNKYKLLDDHMKNIREEHAKMARIAEDRISHHATMISELQQTKTRLMADLELQKQIANETKLTLENSVKESQNLNEQLDKSRAQILEADRKVAASNETLLNKQTQISSLMVDNRSLKDELDSLKLSLARAQGEAKVLQDMTKTHDRLMDALRDAEFRLQHNEDAALSRLQSQLEKAELEVETVNTHNTNLKDQLSGIRKEMAANEARICGERDLARTQLADAREQLAMSEKSLVELRTRLAEMQKQYSTADAGLGGNPARLQEEVNKLRNRNAYLESQLEDMRAKLGEAEAEAAMRGGEVNQLSTMSGRIEFSLKEQTETSNQESARLQCLLKTAESRQAELTSDLMAARRELDAREAELREGETTWNSQKSELEQKIAVLEVQLSDAENASGEVTERLNSVQVEVERKEKEMAEVINQLTMLEGEKAMLGATVEQLKSVVATKEADMQNAEMVVADERTAHAMALEDAERKMAELREEMKKQEEVATKAQGQTEELVEQISKLSNALAIRESSSTTTSSMEVAEDGGMETMHQVLKFLREEKQMALQRSMQAEVEMKRLAAETNELRAERDHLGERIRLRDNEALQNAAALAQRNELLQRLEGMAEAQRENIQLKQEKDRLMTVTNELTQKRNELDKALAEMRVQKMQAERAAAAAQTSAASRLRELEMMRTRAGQTQMEKINQLMHDVAEARARAEKNLVEATEARNKAAEAEKKALLSQKDVELQGAKVKDLETKFASVRGMALRYKKEVQELKEKETVGAAAGTSGVGTVEPASPARGGPQLAKLQQDLATLQEKVNALEQEKKALLAAMDKEREETMKKISDLEQTKFECTMRATMLDKVVASLNKKVQTMQEELDTEKASHTQTRSDLDRCRQSTVAAAAAAQQYAAPAAHAVPAAPTMPTSSSTVPPTVPAVQSSSTPSAPSSFAATTTVPTVPSSTTVPSGFSFLTSSTAPISKTTLSAPSFSSTMPTSSTPSTQKIPTMVTTPQKPTMTSSSVEIPEVPEVSSAPPVPVPVVPAAPTMPTSSVSTFSFKNSSSTPGSFTFGGSSIFKSNAPTTTTASTTVPTVHTSTTVPPTVPSSPALSTHSVSSAVTVSATPQSSSPPPQVASFFGIRTPQRATSDTTQQRSAAQSSAPTSTTSSSSHVSFAPADPAPTMPMMGGSSIGGNTLVAPLVPVPQRADTVPQTQAATSTSSSGSPQLPAAARVSPPGIPLVGNPMCGFAFGRSRTGPGSGPIPMVTFDLLPSTNDDVSLEQQPDTVSGTDEQQRSTVVMRDEDSLSGMDGASQDGLPSAISSSSGMLMGESERGQTSGVSRKRVASMMDDQGAKRQRESPCEDQITSSERNLDMGEGEILLDDETTRDAEAAMDEEDEDDDGIEVVENVDEGDGEELPEVDEVVEMRDQGMFHHDAADGRDHGIYDDEPSEDVQPQEEMIVLDSDSDDDVDEIFDDEDEEEDDEDEGDSEIDEGVERGQGQQWNEGVESDEPSDFDDNEGEQEEGSDRDDGGDADEQTQDAENADLLVLDEPEEREAASAVEEADDEGRGGEREREGGESGRQAEEPESHQHMDEDSEASTQPTQSSSTSSQLKSRRVPITFDVSSSNETAVSPVEPPQQPSTSQPRPSTGTGRRPTRGVFRTLGAALLGGPAGQQSSLRGQSGAPPGAPPGTARRGQPQTAKRSGGLGPRTRASRK